MATAIYIKEDTLREYVAHLKAMVEAGQLEVGKTIFSIAVNDGTQIGPPGMSDGTKRNCRQLMMDCNFLSRVGNILSGKGILNNSFSDYSVDDIVVLGMDACEATKGKAKTKKQTHPTTSRDIPDEAGAPDVPETVAVPVYDLINVLDDDEKEDLIHQLTASLRGSGVNVKKALTEVSQELERRVREIDAVRGELRDTKTQLADAREALGHAKTYVQPRVVERFVHVPNKPAGAPGTGGGAGGYQKGTVVVHRKPLMGHTPKAVRDVKEEK